MINEETNSHGMVIGGFSPFHTGHHMVVQQMKKAGHTSSNVFTTQSGRRPIPVDKKVKYIKTASGEGVNVSSTQTPFHAAAQLHKEGKRGKLVLYGGSDRAAMADQLRQYNGKEGKHGYYKFDSIEFQKVGGERKEGAKGVAGVSGTSARKSKTPSALKKFLPKELHAHAEEIFKHMKESTNPIGIFLLGGPGSGKDYVLKNIFSRFDLIEVQAEQILSGVASELVESGAHIVINGISDLSKIEQIQNILEDYTFDFVHVSVTNKVSRLRNEQREQPLNESKRIDKFLKAEKLADSVGAFIFNNSINLNESSEFEKVFFADQIKRLLERVVDLGLELKEESKTKTYMPSKYKTGNAKTDAARASHWKKMGKYSDRDPRAYKDAPGDKKARAKGMPLSKHTVAVRKMMSEEVVNEGSSDANRIKKHPAVAEYTNEPNWWGVGLDHTIKLKPGYWHKTSKKTTLTPSSYREAHSMLKDVELTPRQVNANRQQTAIDKDIAHRQTGHRMLKIRKHRSTDSLLRPQNEETIDEGASDSSISAKAKKSGISVRTLRKVYNRGVAAWNSGHRPGTTPQQWGHARVNSYINKGKTYHTADKDLRGEEVERFEEDRAWTHEDEYDMHMNAHHAALGSGNNEKAETHVKKAEAAAAKHFMTTGEKIRDPGYTGSSKHIVSEETEQIDEKGPGLWANIHAKRRRIKRGSGERMRKPGEKGAPTASQLKSAKEEVELDEMQLVGTDSYRKHAIAMTPGQGEPTDAFQVKSPNKKPAAVVAKPGKSIVSQYQEHTECGTPNCCGECGSTEEIGNEDASGTGIREAASQDASVDTTPTLTTKKKQTGGKPMRSYNARLAGLSVVSNLSLPEETTAGRSILKNVKTIKLQTEDVQLQEAINYHLTEGISFTENAFRPGSDMFFNMINEAKRLYKEGKYQPEDEYEQDLLNSDIGEKVIYEGEEVILDYPFEELNEKDKGFMPTPRQVPAPPGGHSVPAGYERVKSWGGAWELRKIKDKPTTVKEEDETGGKGVGKPWREGGGGAVYVRTGDGKIKKVRFSQSGMSKKFNDPARVRSFVARHRCLSNKDKTSASYWACRWPRYFSNSGKTWW
jgi:hypothetical protein